MQTTALLFVYGTLMRCASGTMGVAERRRLETESEWIGAGSVPGRLVDLGRYPGFIRDAAGGPRVEGHVVRLRDPEFSLLWLDTYEGLGPGGAPGEEYSRELIDATLGPLSADLTAGASCSLVPVWIYRYRGVLTGLAPIRDGRWTGAGRRR